MKETAELLLLLLLTVDLALMVSSRIFHCINIVALQGILISLLPLTIWDWSNGCPPSELYLIAAVNFAVKALLLPALLGRTVRASGIRRELEPLVGYPLSLALFLLISGGIFWGCRTLLATVMLRSGSYLALPVSLSTMAAGLFIIVARRKALTQVIGFLAFENGITAFGAGMMLHYGIVVELGILLDVLVLVFVMGIAVFQIRREFDHIDADRLNQLGDRSVNFTEEENR